MSILYVQPIFAPDKKRLIRNLDSIKSFASYLKNNPYPGLKVVLGGWTVPEYWDELKKTVMDYMGSGIPIKRFDKNYGKATVVNTLHKSINDGEFEYMLTADSDIVFDVNQPNLFIRSIECAKESEKFRGKPFGMLSMNQMGQNCHLKDHVYRNRHKYAGKFGEEEIVWPHGAGGIAGGCIFTSSKCWKSVGGYRIMGCYAGDDAYYLIDTINKGYTIQMYETGKIIHPLDDDVEYAKWKVKVCQRDSGPVKTDLSKFVAEADEFWRNRSK